LILIAASVNPWVEYLMYRDPVPYMLSHYALYVAGFIVGNRYLYMPTYLIPLGVLPLVMWHTPTLFILGGTVALFRVIDHVTMFLGGIVAGSCTRGLSVMAKIILFALYMLGDTYLAIIYLLGGEAYASPYSPYEAGDFLTLGLTMLIIMNIITAYVVFSILRKQ